MELQRVMDNVFWLQGKGRQLVSLNLVRGQTVYGERTFNVSGKEYREWIPSRSKLAAALYKGLKDLDLKTGYKVLYLGASSGTTVSHVSDIAGENGQVYAVEVSEEMGANLILLAEKRKNISPIISDARKPDEYPAGIPKCDFLYQDVAQRDQVEIFLKNIEMFLKNGGSAALAIKTRSVDVSKPSRKVVEDTVRALRARLDVKTSIDLYPYQKDHALIIVRKNVQPTGKSDKNK
jgi:fibrillarin-like pre-rRNA processing protein